MTRNFRTDGSSTGTSDDAELTASRRRVLLGVGGAGLAFGVGRAAGQPTESFELGGDVGGWYGRSPAGIADQTNPTLSLSAGQQYEVTWENLDGQPHNLVLRDDAGNQLVRSDVMSEQGATQTVVFTATEAMTAYICEVHPDAMVGAVSTGGSPGGSTAT